jgi:isocitrate dehydrogenase
MIAGQNIANPSGLLQGAILMLTHIGQTAVAQKIQNAWLKTIEDGVHTFDIYKEGTSKVKVGTKEFAEAVIANLGQQPSVLQSVTYSDNTIMNLPKYQRKAPAKKELVGVDVFVHWTGEDPNALADLVNQINIEGAQLSMITNRGIKVWPEGFKETFCTDHWRCRFKPAKGASTTKQTIIQLLSKAVDLNIDVIKTENLYAFDGVEKYSLGQGQ